MQPRSQRRVHSAEFKAQVLAECQQSGASVAAVALAHGLNVNLLRKWLVDRGIKRTGLAATCTAAAPEPAQPPAAEDIRIELTRGATRKLGAKNWLFAGSALAGQRAAVVMSLVQSAKLNGLDPWAYLRDVLARIHTHPSQRLEELLPHRWRPA
jgi:transposase-like protein